MTKEHRTTFRAGLVLALASLILPACSPKSEPPQAQTAPSAKTATVDTASASTAGKPGFVSAEKNSFAEVTAHLDPGGSLYMYLGTEQWLDGLSAKTEGWRSFVLSLPDVEEDKEEVTMAFDVVGRLIRNSGLEEISGVGISGIAREKGLNRTKVLIHHYPGKDKGYVWTLAGKTPHELHGLKYLPATTALAAFNDLDVAQIWSIIKKEVAAVSPKAKEGLEEFSSEIGEELGMELEKLLGSFSGEMGFVLTLDETKRMPLPFPGQSGETMTMAEPGFFLAVKVKDQTLFDLVEGKLPPDQNIAKVDEAGLKMRTMPLPLPFPLRPTIAQFGDYFILASTDTLVREVVAVNKGQKPGLIASPEFTRMSKDIPTQGNGFSYVSERFGKTWMELQLGIMEMSAKSSSDPAADAFGKAFAKKFLGSTATTTFSVFANTEHGWQFTANTSDEPAKFLLAPAVVLVVPMAAAIAIPNFVKARGTAQKNACIANLKQIDGATQQWALENRKGDKDKVNREAMIQYLKGGRMPVCPAGGSYSTGIVEEAPKCTIHGHELPY